MHPVAKLGMMAGSDVRMSETSFRMLQPALPERKKPGERGSEVNGRWKYPKAWKRT